MNNKRHARGLDLRLLQDGPENIKERSPLATLEKHKHKESNRYNN
jgi:hypothetical protein